MTKHQAANVEHREYVAWLHTQPCAACGYRGEAIQAAHVGVGGVGLKHGSDAETIPLCGPRWVGFYLQHGRGAIAGCHADHDQLAGEFQLFTREMLQLWNATQVAAHRGRFEARNVDAQGECPF